MNRWLRSSWSIHVVVGLIVCLFWSGCTTPRQIFSPQPAPPANTGPIVPSIIESAIFTTPVSRAQVIDAATVILVANNFSITLANERIGLLQSDYLPLQVLRTTQVDTAGQSIALNQLLMKITLNVEPRADVQYVQVKGTLQNIGTSRGDADNIIGLYWLERVAQDLAEELRAEYTPKVSPSVYSQALRGRTAQVTATNAGNPANPSSQPQQTTRNRFSNLIKGIAIVVGIMFVLTLVVGGSTPSSG